MKSWEFTKIENNRIKIDSWLSDAMGLVDGGCVYSTLFKYPEAGPKRYELILSMYPQENFRTLAQVTVFAEDVFADTQCERNALMLNILIGIYVLKELEGRVSRSLYGPEVSDYGCQKNPEPL